MTEKEIKKYLLKNSWKICRKTRKWHSPYFHHMFKNLSLEEAWLVQKSLTIENNRRFSETYPFDI